MPSPDLLSDASDELRGTGDVLAGAADPLRGASDLLRRASEMVPGAAPRRGGVSASAPEALTQLVSLATSQVTGCSGASATLWQDREPAVFAASHPDLAELAGIEQRCGCGPVATALAAGGPVWSPDTLAEDRWPQYAAAALACGVRCSATLVRQSGPLVVTLSLFGAQPGGLGAQTPAAIGS
jgi:hypothetical protein